MNILNTIVTDIKNLLKGTSLELFDVEFNSTNGGVYFFVAQKAIILYHLQKIRLTK